MKRWLAFAAFVASVPLANWMIGNVGTCIPGGPCIIPVGFGLAAPSGVLVVGVALVARDVVQEEDGIIGALFAIGVGAYISAAFVPTSLLIASIASFALSELADLAVYTPLRRRKLVTAVMLSGLAGSIVDSAVFLIVAFGSLDLMAGQVVGKMWATLAACAFLTVRRSTSRKVA